MQPSKKKEKKQEITPILKGGTLEVIFLFCFCFLWGFLGGGVSNNINVNRNFHTFIIYNVVRFLPTDKTTNGIINKQRGTTCSI